MADPDEADWDDAAYRAIVERVPAIFYTDAAEPPYQPLYVSPQVTEMFGCAPEEWMSDPEYRLALVHPDDRPHVVESAGSAGRTGGDFVEEYRLRSNGGRWMWVQDRASLIRDADGRPRFWQGVLVDVTERKELDLELARRTDELAAADKERRRLLARLVQVAEDERRRVAEDLHDDAIQSLTALALRLATLARGPGKALAPDLGRIERDLANTMARLRQVLFELHPSALDRPGGLRELLRASLQHLAEESGVAVSLDEAVEVELSSEVRAICYRIAQEAFANIRKHAGATTVEVRIRSLDDGVEVVIGDDGVGFVPQEVNGRPGHIGLVIMRERADLAGGWIDVDSAPGAGTTIRFWIPQSAGSRDER